MTRPNSPRGRRHSRRTRKQSSHGPKKEHLPELHPVDEPPSIQSFEEWPLGEEIQRAIRNMDISVPTPIQSLAIGPALEGRDVIAKAETGTGKTLAFGAPLMSRTDPARASVLGLILCPTRELAQQVANVIEALGLTRGLRVALVVGGDPMHPQVNALQAGAQVVVGTPGRVLDLYEQRFLSFPWTEWAVLDEADKMFEIGFLDDVKRILSYLPDERQTLLFSATFPTEVLKLARAETRDPVEVATRVGTVTAEGIEQLWMEVDDEDRPLLLTRLLEQSGEKDVFLVFCDRRTDVDRLMRRLDRLPYGIKALHGGYDQASRFRVMSAYRTGEVKALVATDVASRGLDVEHVTHVVNFGVPRELEDYAHRIGRTGRAGRTGTAITFVTHAMRRRWKALLDRAKWPIEKVDAPDRTTSRPRAERRGRRDERAGEERGRGGRGEPRRGGEGSERRRARSDSGRPEGRERSSERGRTAARGRGGAEAREPGAPARATDARPFGAEVVVPSEHATAGKDRRRRRDSQRRTRPKGRPEPRDGGTGGFGAGLD